MNVKDKDLLHENSTGKADRLADGGDHQTVVHPRLLKPANQVESLNLAFLLLSYLTEADYGPLYNDHNCHH